MGPDWACWGWAAGVLGCTGLKSEQRFRSWSSAQGQVDSTGQKMKPLHRVSTNMSIWCLLYSIIVRSKLECTRILLELLHPLEWKIKSPYSSLKSSLKAGQFIENTAQSPDITLLVVRLSFAQLWGNVAWSPNHLPEKRRHYILFKIVSKKCKK